jgi:hypothetical protein
MVEVRRLVKESLFAYELTILRVVEVSECVARLRQCVIQRAGEKEVPARTLAGISPRQMGRRTNGLFSSVSDRPKYPELAPRSDT